MAIDDITYGGVRPRDRPLRELFPLNPTFEEWRSVGQPDHHDAGRSIWNRRRKKRRLPISNFKVSTNNSISQDPLIVSLGQ